jgi:transposase InsO family protein
MSQEFDDHLKSRGIVPHLTPPGTPQRNGVSEQRNRTLLDMVRSMVRKSHTSGYLVGHDSGDML